MSLEGDWETPKKLEVNGIGSQGGQVELSG